VLRRFAHDELFDARAGCAELVVQRVKRHGAALDEHGHLAALLDGDEPPLERLDAREDNQNDDDRRNRSRAEPAADRQPDSGNLLEII
jgi:hypothetical protein